jgi:hypothetical protein
MPPEEKNFNYQVAYKEKLKEDAELKEENKKLIEYNKSLIERLEQSDKQYENHAEKYLEETKKNRKLKTIIAKLLEEKYCKDGD